MIKINLVPLKEKKKQQEYVLVLAGIAAGMVFILILFWVYIQKIQTERDLNAQITKVENESKQYEGKIAEVNAFQNIQQELDTTNKTIAEIQTTQKSVVFMLDQLAINLPQGVWLTGVSQQEEKSGKGEVDFVVDGCAFSLAGVQAYYQALVHTEGLSPDVTLDIESDSFAAASDEIIQFEIITKMADEKS